MGTPYFEIVKLRPVSANIGHPLNGVPALKLRVLACLSLLAVLAVGCKENPHDNARVPDPSSDKPVYNHRFDGGETNPYYEPGEQGGEGEKGGEKAAPAEKSGH